MSRFLTWLAGVPGLEAGGAGVRLQFAYELSPTVWAIVVLGALGLGLFGYWRVGVPVWVRVVCGVLRGCAVVLVVVLLTGPRLVQVSERVEKDWVLGVVDRSGSMGIGTREEQVRGLLEGSRGAWEQIARERRLGWVGFDVGGYDLGVDGGALPVLGKPVGRGTDIGGAIEGALARASGRPISGVVLFSDGRSTVPVPGELVRRLAAERIGVYVVPIGEGEGTGDLSVLGVDAPASAFAGDAVPVQVKVQRTGRLPGPVRVQLVDEASGRVLDEQVVGMPQGHEGVEESTAVVTLTGTPEGGSGEKQRRWVVRVPTVEGELVEGNNERAVTLGLVDRPLRLAFIDGYPRWEYRFVKNVLAREKSLSFVATLLSPGRRYISEGTEEVFALPTTAQEWERFDVMMLGDVQPGVLTPEQMLQVRARVAVGGAGLIWIAGESAVPQGWAGTPLADLLPMVVSSERPGLWEQDVVMRPTALAEKLGVLRLGDRQEGGGFWPAQIGDPGSGWSRLRWAQRLDAGRLKPAAEVLAEAHPVEGGGAPSPLVVTMRYGAGRVVYIGTDEVWRYRYGQGEGYVERFYLQLVRLLGRESVGRAGKGAVMQITPGRAEVGKGARVSVELVDQVLAEGAPGVLTARLRRVAGAGEEAGVPMDVPLRPDGGSGRKVYVGTWVPVQAGAYVGEVVGSVLEGQGVGASAEVFLSGDELRRPEGDAAALAKLAELTGGQVLTAEGLGRLSQTLPRREIKVVTVGKEQTLWDRGLWVVVLVVLLGCEWSLRRLFRLT